MQLERADVEALVKNPIITGAALVIQRRWGEVGITCVDSRAARQEFMSESLATIILQRAEQRIGVDLVARSSQKARAIVTAKIVT